MSIRDKAAFYYRSMEKDFKQFRKLFFTVKAEYVVPLPVPYQFNSLSLVLQRPSESFLKPLEYFTSKRRKEEGFDELPQEVEPQPVQTRREETDLLGGQNQHMITSRRMIQADQLDQNCQLQQQEFQRIWDNSEEVSFTRMLLDARVLDTDNLDQLFSLYRLRVMASGEEESEIRMYVYAVEKSQQGKVCCEVNVNRDTNLLVLTGKSDDEQLASFVLKYIEGFFVEEGLI